MSLLTVGKKITQFASRHPSSVMLPAAIAGVAVTRPVRTISTQIGTSFAGDPNYFRKLITGGVLGNLGDGWQGPNQPGFGANILTTGSTPGITTEGGGYSANPDPDQALRMSEQSGSNPDGSIVFGLYNNRLR